MNSPSPHLLRAISGSASIMKARSCSVAAARCSPSTAIGVSHESQSSIVNRNGWVNVAYHGVYSFNSHKSHFAMRQGFSRLARRRQEFVALQINGLHVYSGCEDASEEVADGRERRCTGAA